MGAGLPYSTAQVLALACHLNARCRGMSVERMFPGNSTCRFCEFVRFVQIVPRSTRIGGLPECIESPDEWLDALLHNGASRSLIFYTGFPGVGGDWWIAVEHCGQLNYWQAYWPIGHRNAVDQHIWRVQYDETDLRPPNGLPVASVAELSEQLSSTLVSIEQFATEHQLNLAARFRKVNHSLSADGEWLVAEHYYTDLDPVGSLSLPARRLLACCEDAYVFGGMGSWNEERIGLEGDASRSYRVLSDQLFELLNRSLCAAANESAPER